MFKKILISFVVIGGMGFFEPSALERPVIGAIHLMIIGVMIAFMILHTVYDRTPRIKPGFAIEFALIGLAVLLSFFGAYAYHAQDFKVSLLAQRIAYFFLLYPFLHQLKPDPAFLGRLLVIAGLLWAILYLIQWAAYPVQLFGEKMMKDRNTIRIAIPGVAFGVAAYYYAFVRFLKTNHFKYLLFVIFVFFVFVLLGTRQLIAPVVLISLWIIIRSKRVQSKIVLSILVAICSIPIYLIFSDIFDAMMEVTRQQSTSLTHNVRYKAAGFFLMKFSANDLSFLTGNGAYSNRSSYGIMMENYSKLFGYYLADIGIIGEYILYGIIFVAAEIVILIRMIVTRLPEELTYVHYIAYSTLFSLFVSSGISGGTEGILLFCMVLYLVDVARHKEKETAQAKDVIVAT